MISPIRKLNSYIVLPKAKTSKQKLDKKLVDGKMRSI